MADSTSSSPSSPDPLAVTSGLAATESHAPPVSPAATTHSKALNVPAIVEWTEEEDDQDNGHVESHRACYLGHSTANPVHLIVDFDTSNKTAVFRLSIVVALRKQGAKPFRGRETLYLCLQPNGRRRLSLDASHLEQGQGKGPQPPAELRTRLAQGPNKPLVRFSAELTGPADFIAPDWPLTPQNKAHGAVLDSFMRLARQSAFRIYVQDDLALPMDSLKSLCTSVSSQEVVQPDDDDVSGELGGFYRGRHAKIIDAGLLMPTANRGPNPDPDPAHPPDDAQLHVIADPSPGPTRNPPAYDDLNSPPPPTAPLTGGDGAGSGGGERKRRRASSSGPSSNPGLGAVVSGVSMDELRAYVDGLSRKAIAEEVVPLRQRVTQLEQRLSIVEGERDEARGRVVKLEEEVEELEARIDDRVWVEVDELGTSIREEFQDLERDIRHEAAEAADDAIEGVVSRHLANARVHILDGRLEIDFDDDDSNNNRR